MRISFTSFLLLITFLHLCVITKANAATFSGTFYIDCTSGNDNNNGTSQANAWKTLNKLSAENANGTLVNTFGPGSSILLKRGCTFEAPLILKSNGTQTQPITVTTYGSGSVPRIQRTQGTGAVVGIGGSYQILQDIEVYTALDAYTLIQTGLPASSCIQPFGFRPGISFGGSFNTVKNAKVSHSSPGVHLLGNNNSLLYSQIIDNDSVWELQDYLPGQNGVDSTNDLGEAYWQTLGGMAVNLTGDNNVIAFNRFARNEATCSPESNTIELFGASNNYIRHNIAIGDRVFSETGGASSTNNTWAYNLVINKKTYSNNQPRFLVIPGADRDFGPVTGSKIYNNTVYFTSADGTGGGRANAVVCNNCEADIKNNIFLSQTNSWGQSTRSNNTILSPDDIGTSIIPFTNPGNNNFHLKSASSPIDAGFNLSLGFTYDLDQVANSIPVGAFDQGAYEFGAVPAPTAVPDLPAATPTPPSTKTTGRINGKVFIDTDGDGILGKQEGVVSNDTNYTASATITLTDISTGTQTTAITNQYGNYQFTSLPLGKTYTVKLTSPSGYSTTSPISVSVSLVANISVHFGLTQGNTPTLTPTNLGNGDANQDGSVNSLDLKVILQNWLASLTSSLDQFKDGRINAMDFVRVLKQMP